MENKNPQIIKNYPKKLKKTKRNNKWRRVLTMEEYLNFQLRNTKYEDVVFGYKKLSKEDFFKKFKKEIKEIPKEIFKKYVKVGDNNTFFFVINSFFKKYSSTKRVLITGCGHEIPSKYYPKDTDGKHSCYLRQEKRVYHDNAITLDMSITNNPDILYCLDDNNNDVLVKFLQNRSIIIKEIIGCGLYTLFFEDTVKDLTKRIYPYGGIWPPSGYK